MLRRLIKPAKFLLTLACIVFTVPPMSFIEAVTQRTLGELLGGETLIEGDKTFSGFTFEPSAAPGPEGTSATGPVFPGANSLIVTASTGIGGVITLSLPINILATTNAGASGAAFSSVDFGFNVAVTGSDLITGVTLTSIGDPSTGSSIGTGASVVATFTGVSGALNVTSPGSGSRGIPPPGPSGIAVGGTAAVAAVAGDDMNRAEIDTVTFDIAQTTPSTPVPEPGSLTLILGGVGMLLAHGLYRRKD